MSSIRYRKVIVAIAAASAAIFPTRADAVEFAVPASYAVGGAPAAAVVADFNGDGKPDLAVLCGTNVSILVAKGDGTFQTAVNFPTGSEGSVLTVGDFNGDGKADLAAFQQGDSNASASGVVSVLLGNGNGTFQAPTLTTLTPSATAIVGGDFNGDQKTDLVVANSDASSGGISLHILTGKGDGTFESPKAILSGAQTANLVAADFNKDGKLDLGVAVSGGVQVLLGRGDATFQAGSTAAVAAGFTVGFILTTDFNGDGNIDLLVSSGQNSCNGFNCTGKQNASVFLGIGNGTFGAEQVLAEGTSSRGELFGRSDGFESFVVGQFNGDGKLDLVDRHSIQNPVVNSATLETRLGRGDGSFATPIVFTDSGVVAAAADLNGDTLADLLILDSSTKSVVVLLNTSPASGADLGILSASVPAQVGQGVNLTFAGDVINEGPLSASNVNLTDTLPSGVIFVSAVSTKGACTRSNLTVTCAIGSLGSADEAQVTIVVTPTATGAISNSMSVSATETDLVTANNQVTETTTVLPVYTLTVNKSGNGDGVIDSSYNPSTGSGGAISCGSTCSATFLSGTQLTVGFQADGKNFLESWSGDCTGNGDCKITMDSNKSLTAKIVAAATLTVTITGTGAGTVTDNGPGGSNIICSNGQGACLGYYFPGTSVSLTAAAAANSTFAGWSGACTGKDQSSCNITLSTNETLTASFNSPGDFSVLLASKALTLQQGRTVTEVVSITESNGFSSAIQLSCSVSGPPPMPTCSLSPANIPPGANSPTSTLSVSIPAKSVHLPSLIGESKPRRPYGFAIALVFVWLAAFLVMRRSGAGQSPRLTLQMARILAFVAIALSLDACGGGSPTSSGGQAFTVTVTATSGTIQHSTSINLIVN